jgi:hypothetical protein
MFSSHFQSFFSPYDLIDGVVVAWDACYRVVPCKVSSGDWDQLDRDFLRDELFTGLSTMQNGKSLRHDGLPCEFYKAMWDSMVIISVIWI